MTRRLQQHVRQTVKRRRVKKGSIAASIGDRMEAIVSAVQPDVRQTGEPATPHRDGLHLVAFSEHLELDVSARLSDCEEDVEALLIVQSLPAQSTLAGSGGGSGKAIASAYGGNSCQNGTRRTRRSDKWYRRRIVSRYGALSISTRSMKSRTSGMYVLA